MEELGVATSVELCVKALQLPKQDDSDSRISVCKTVSCLLSDDLEVSRACLLTEFLFGPSQEVFQLLEELYLRPDQKYDQENMVIPNSLRCELLLALKSYWPFDPEFWDWKTLKHHCISLLGLKPESEGEQDAVDSQEKCKIPEPQATRVDSEIQNTFNGLCESNKQSKHKSSNLQKESKTKKLKYQCQICKRSVIDAQIVHHSKKHAQERVHPCPVCLQKFKSRKDLVPHLKQHMNSDTPFKKNNVKAEEVLKESDEDNDVVEPGEIIVDPSLMMYYKSTRDPDVLHHIVQQAKSTKREDDDEHVTFDYIYRHFNLQNRDEYPCPGTGCAKIFKHSKYLYVHLKSEHGADANVKYFHKMRDKREKCAFCRRHLVSAYHYRKHHEVHCGDKPYICLVIGCGARFSSSNQLVLHKQTHNYRLNYQCELKGCRITYSDLGQIYHHEAQHFRDAAFTCTAHKCRKYYLSKKAFIEHLATHKIYFSEQDFEAQRKAKRKLHKSSAGEGSSDQSRSANDHVLDDSCCSSPAGASECREGKSTLVAVCFDGSKFTCGFEKCGMTFSRARDVQRHLKCAHPEHLKMENKEHKHDRERGSKSKGVRAENMESTKEKGQNKPPMPFLPVKTGKEKKSSTYTKSNEASAINDALKEVVVGLGKLDLNCVSSHSESSESPAPTPETNTPETSTSEMSRHLAIMEKPPVVVLQKKILHLPGVELDCAFKQISTNEGGCQESLATAKPYICEETGCGFRTAQSYSLLRHYCTLHRRTLEQAKEIPCLRNASFKPYVCQLCSKAHRQKRLLRAHYIDKHNLSATLVDKISCGSVRCEGNKTTKLLEHSSNPKKKKTTTTMHQPITDNEQKSAEEGNDSLDKKEPNNEQQSENEVETTHQGRAKRLVAKSNLCYILDKFSKPFHCVAKNCAAAFSTQAGLVRHLQLVHHYNRSQLLLENDFGKNSPEMRKEPAKKKPPPNLDEPQPQYKCHFANCHASYHLKSSLVRHTQAMHSQPEGMRCKYDGCTSAFGHNPALQKHALYKHCGFYDSLVVRLQSTHKKSESGCQKKLVVTSQSPPKEEPDTPETQNIQSSPEPVETDHFLDSNQNEQRESAAKNNKKIKRNGLKSDVFRSHEEALQMCQDRCFPVAYPCMIQNCDTVVKYLKSLPRHYINVHRLRKIDIVENKNELILNAEQLEEIIQRKSARSTGVPSPNGVHKMEYQTEAENPGGQSAPMSLHSIKEETQGETNEDPLGFPEEEEQEQPSVERNGMLVGADDVLYGEPSTGRNTKETAIPTPNCLKRQERLSLEQIKPLLRPVTVDLSPPCSLRFISEEGFVDLSNNKDGIKMLNGSVSVPSPYIRQPLKRKNDLSLCEASNAPDTEPLSSSPRPFDIAAYKPVGFETSFLKFIQDSAPKEKTVTCTKRQHIFKRSCSVKENNQLGVSLTRRRTHSPLLKPRAVTGDLKSILDKALAGCGDLAIKQLQYLRPVVVLGRPVCSTALSDLFPADTNNSKLLLGS